jgi:hypothetical protein
MKRFSGNPLKKPNSIGVKKEEYTAHNSINIVHARYHLHYFNCNVSFLFHKHKKSRKRFVLIWIRFNIESLVQNKGSAMHQTKPGAGGTRT